MPGCVGLRRNNLRPFHTIMQVCNETHGLYTVVIVNSHMLLSPTVGGQHATFIRNYFIKNYLQTNLQQKYSGPVRGYDFNLLLR